MLSQIVIRVSFLFEGFFLLFYYSMYKVVSVCVSMFVCLHDTFEENTGIVADSLACEMWIVNDITGCKSCLFYVSGLFV